MVKFDVSPTLNYGERKMIKILRAFVVFSFIGLVCERCGNSNQKDQYYISTQSQSDDRVKKLHLDKRSEDATYILDTNKLATPASKHNESKTDTTAGKVVKEFNRDAIIVLKSDDHFNGVAVWDVLQSIGLKWGDGDLFHWENHRRDYGDDQLFSVWTTTDPGYFLPESVKSGEMNPTNLVFGFSIPRNADPKNVFDVMVKAVKYSQEHLGGKILNDKELPFQEEEEKKNLKLLIDKMQKSGVIPGSDKALLTY